MSSLKALQQFPLAPDGNVISSRRRQKNLEGSSSWELLQELKGAPTELLEEPPGCS